MLPLSVSFCFSSVIHRSRHVQTTSFDLARASMTHMRASRPCSDRKSFDNILIRQMHIYLQMASTQAGFAVLGLNALCCTLPPYSTLRPPKGGKSFHFVSLPLTFVLISPSLRSHCARVLARFLTERPMRSQSFCQRALRVCAASRRPFVLVPSCRSHRPTGLQHGEGQHQRATPTWGPL